MAHVVDGKEGADEECSGTTRVQLERSLTARKGTLSHDQLGLYEHTFLDLCSCSLFEQQYVNADISTHFYRDEKVRKRDAYPGLLRSKLLLAAYLECEVNRRFMGLYVELLLYSGSTGLLPIPLTCL